MAYNLDYINDASVAEIINSNFERKLLKLNIIIKVYLLIYES